MHKSHKKHHSAHTKVAQVEMHGHGPHSNLKMPAPGQTVHVAPKRASGPSRRATEMLAGGGERPEENPFDSGKK